MVIKERIEFSEIQKYILDNKISEAFQNLKKNFSSLRESNSTSQEITKETERIIQFLEFFHTFERPITFLEMLSNTPPLSRLTFTNAISRFISSGDNTLLLRAIKKIEDQIILIQQYNLYLNKYEHSKLLNKLDHSIAFSFEIGKEVVFNTSLVRMQHINGMFKHLNALFGTDEKFEIIHVEDGSLKMFVMASIVMIKVISPLSETIEKHTSSIMDLIHKSNLQNIEKELKEEELKHQKSINQKREEDLQIKNEVNKELLNLKLQSYKDRIEFQKQLLEAELEYKIFELNIRFKDQFKHTDNTEKLLRTIAHSIKDHFLNRGHIETFQIEDKNSENLEEFKKLLAITTDEDLKLIEQAPPRNKTDEDSSSQ